MSTKSKYFNVSGRAHTAAVRRRLKVKRRNFISRPRPLKGKEKKTLVRVRIAIRHMPV